MISGPADPPSAKQVSAHLSPHRQCAKQVLDSHCGAHSSSNGAAASQASVPVELEACGCCQLCCACDDGQVTQGTEGAQGLTTESIGVQGLQHKQ